MKIKAYAKINLTLDILKKEQKYHRIQTLLCKIPLCDTLTFTPIQERKIIISSNHKDLPLGAKNLVYKAVMLLKKTKNHGGLRIHIQKKIPIAAGLGGGSSDAAATLLAVNKLWKLKMPLKKLEALAVKIGMDVPFFLRANAHPQKQTTALGTHYGEKITLLPSATLPPLLVALHGKKISTKKSYQQIDTKKTGQQTPLTKKFIIALKKHHLFALTSLCHNDFETIKPDSLDKNDQLAQDLKKKLLRSGATLVHTCGSGPALYAFYKTPTAQKKAYKELQKYTDFIHIFL